MSSNPRLILRLGSHSEKEYFEKTVRFLDGISVGANLFEVTPGATSSLLLKFCGEPRRVPYYVDPMTYAFGAYHDPQTGRLRVDLDWIKSDQKVRKAPVRDFKRSYRALAKALGPPFSDAIEDGVAVDPSHFQKPSRTCADVAARVVDYQLGRIVGEMRKDESLAPLVDKAPRPAAVFAPYFYIEPTNATAWYKANLNLAASAAALGNGVPVHLVLCADVSALSSAEFLARVEADIPGTGVAGVWLWFSGLDEDDSRDPRELEITLRSFRRLVVSLSSKLEVYNMHGGFLSMALAKFGMMGVSHGVGYGEQKGVLPVVGQSIPTVRYYLPDIHRTLGVPDLQASFGVLRLKTPADFHKQICNCAICRGVVARSTDQFGMFGELHPSGKRDSKRLIQTPAAAKRCRYHFMLRRLTERSSVARMTTVDIIHSMESAFDRWNTLPTVQRYCSHLPVWKRLLQT